MKKPHFSLLLLLACAGLVGAAHAEKADRNKPMNIEADALRYDDVKQVSIFTGNVVMTKGTIVIRGARVEVQQDPDGYQFGVVTGTPGKQAFFRQKREALDEFIEGEGDSIEYDGHADTVKFIKKALLRRYRGATLADEISGALIVYENLTDRFTVDGNASNAGKSVGVAPGGRVRAMLMPKPEGAAVIPAATAPTQAVPALRATPTLEGPPK